MRKSRTRLLFAAAWAPALLTAWLIAQHAVDLPAHDEWDTPGVAIQENARGALSWSVLAAQHNESRMLVPRLVSLGLLAANDQWDVRSAMWASFAVVCATALGLAWLARRELRLSGARLAATLLLVHSTLFNPSQAFNWLFGIQISFFLPFFFLVACLVVTTTRWPAGAKVVLVGVLSFLASFTHAAGFLCWPLAGVALFVRLRRERLSRRAMSQLAAVWGGFLALCLALYFSSYTKPPTHPALADAWVHPLAAARFFLAYLSGPVLGRPPVAPAWIGGAALVAFAAFLGLGRSRPPQERRGELLCGVLAAAALASAALVTVGRLGFGDVAAVELRYTTFGVPLYVALVFAGALALEGRDGEAALGRRLRLALVCLVATAFVALSGIAAWSGIGQMKVQEREHRLARAALYWVDPLGPGQILRSALPRPRHLAQARRLDGYGLLRPGIADPEAWQAATASLAENSRFGRIDELGLRMRRHRLRVVVSGWAFLPDRWRPVDAVVVAARRGDEWFAVGLAASGETRLDIAAQNGSPYRESGWSVEIPCRGLLNVTQIAAWAFDGDGPALYPLVGHFDLSPELCAAEFRVVRLAPQPIATSRSYRELGFLRAGDGVVVTGSGELHLLADKGVVLENGFRLEAGGWLRLQSPYR